MQIFFSVGNQRHDSAIQDLQNFFAEKSSDTRLVNFVFWKSSDPRPFPCFTHILFSNQRPDLAIQGPYNFVLALEYVPQLRSYDIFIPYWPLC